MMVGWALSSILISTSWRGRCGSRCRSSSIAGISQRTGVTSSSHFGGSSAWSRAFERPARVLPKHYREAAQRSCAADRGARRPEALVSAARRGARSRVRGGLHPLRRLHRRLPRARDPQDAGERRRPSGRHALPRSDDARLHRLRGHAVRRGVRDWSVDEGTVEHGTHGHLGARSAALHHIPGSRVRRLRARLPHRRAGARARRSRTSCAEAGRLRWLRSLCDGLRDFAIVAETEPRVSPPPPDVPYRVEKPWGYELIWAKAQKYAGKILHIEQGHVLSLQYHNKKDESIYVLSGEIILRLQQGETLMERRVRAGEAFHVPPKQIHQFEAVVVTDLLEASTPELDDVVRLKDCYGRLP